MKVALAHSFLGGKAGGGGGVRQMLALGRALQTQGHEVVICTQMYEPGAIEPEPSDQFEVRAVSTGDFKIPASRPAFIWYSVAETRKLAALVPSDADVFNVHEFPSHIAGYHLTRKRDTPVVWTRNDATLYEIGVAPERTSTPAGSPAFQFARRVLGYPDKLAARSMAAIVVLDSHNKALVKDVYGCDAETISSGADDRFFAAPDRAAAREQLGIPADEFSVLSVGIAAPYRRHEDLIRAMAIVRDAGHDRKIHARIIASDHLFPEVGANMRRLVAELNLEEVVTLEQQGVGNDALIAHMAAADAFVFPNELQSWGLAPLEAIAAGTPVIVSSGAGVHEVLEGKPGTVIVDPRSPDQIAEGLGAIMRDPSGFDVTETREWTREKFGLDTYARRMSELFARVV